LKRKEGLLLYVQVDHLNGEIIGAVIDMLYRAGAYNVNVISSLTKKNRPGNIFVIDCDPARVDEVEKIVCRELGTGGWHRISTEHAHVPVFSIKRAVMVCGGNFQFDFTFYAKVIGDDKKNTRPENESCMFLKTLLEDEHGSVIALTEINRVLHEVLLDESITEVFISENHITPGSGAQKPQNKPEEKPLYERY